MRLSTQLFLWGLAMFTTGCAVRGTVIDRTQQSSVVNAMRLSGHPAIRIYCGGARRELPLKSVRMVKIDATQTTSVDGELYLGAEVEFRDGTRIGASENKSRCYISAENELVGKSAKGSYSITFDNIVSFSVGKQ